MMPLFQELRMAREQYINSLHQVAKEAAECGDTALARAALEEAQEMLTRNASLTCPDVH